MCIKGDLVSLNLCLEYIATKQLKTWNIYHLKDAELRKHSKESSFQDFQIDRKRSIRNEVEANQFIDLICFIEQVSTATVTTGFVVKEEMSLRHLSEILIVEDCIRR